MCLTQVGRGILIRGYRSKTLLCIRTSSSSSISRSSNNTSTMQRRRCNLGRNHLVRYGLLYSSRHQFLTMYTVLKADLDSSSLEPDFDDPNFDYDYDDENDHITLGGLCHFCVIYVNWIWAIRGRFTISRSEVSCREHRRPKHACQHNSSLDARLSFCHRNPRSESIFLLPIPISDDNRGASICFSSSERLILSTMPSPHMFDFPQLIPQLLSFPLGRLWEAFVPQWSILGTPLNPGPFTVKEHVLVTIMGGVGAVSAYGTDIIAVQRVFYNQDFSFAYQWLVVMSTQLMGFALGGIGKRFLVSPPSMSKYQEPYPSPFCVWSSWNNFVLVWPSNLVSCALFNTLHSQQYSGIGNRAGVTRERFFLYAFLGSFFWYFLPGYLFTALSCFTWVTWIFPQNRTINQLFGYNSGLGMSILTFDWGQIAYIGSPLATPWWAEANIAVGFTLFFWVLSPILYFTNTWYSRFLPMSTRYSYDNTGHHYNVSRILSPGATFNEEEYHNYSPLFLSTTFVLSYGLSFASIPATLMHAVLYFRQQIWNQSRRSLSEQPDIHARLMAQYKQVPVWWVSASLSIRSNAQYITRWYICIFGEQVQAWRSVYWVLAHLIYSHHIRIWCCSQRGLEYADARVGLLFGFAHLYVHPFNIISDIS